MSLLLTIIVAAVVFLLSATFIIFIIGPTILLQPRRRTKEFYAALKQPVAPADLSLAFETTEVVVNDSITLSGWLVKSTKPARGTILFLHGVGDCKIAGVPYAKLFHDHGFHTFLYDSRRHGESGGAFCTYGYYEKHDVVSIINYLAFRNDLKLGKIGVFGTSMGAAVAIQAAAIDKRIVAIAAENSFATLRTIFDDYQKRIIKLPFHYLRNIIIKRSELMAKFVANDVSPLASVEAIHLPILFVCCTEDWNIDPSYSKMLYENTDLPKELYPIPGAHHNDAWQVGGTAYQRKLIEFFERNLS